MIVYIIGVILILIIAYLIIKIGSPTETKIRILPLSYLDFFEFTWDSCSPPENIITEPIKEDKPKIEVFITEFKGELYKGNKISPVIKVVNNYNITYDIYGEWVNLYNLYDNPIREKHCKNSSFAYLNINNTTHWYIPSLCKLDKTGTWEFDVKIMYDKSFDGEGIKRDNRTFRVSELR